ncbi:hypothetical protein CCACVL1_04166 [Corchorus capsularis]|uniref:Uncharacterized protein n=1 Tax=Corchorus capsularis TaxID=210143 RepID=A0A1R3JUV4_COCAP|nr:hypothetical protein CCACVL1_04166 [Corchorus capsularis]
MEVANYTIRYKNTTSRDKKNDETMAKGD